MRRTRGCSPISPTARGTAADSSPSEAHPNRPHGVDVTDTLDIGIASLRCHEIYLANLGGDMADPTAFLRTNAERDGRAVGVALATTFEMVTL